MSKILDVVAIFLRNIKVVIQENKIKSKDLYVTKSKTNSETQLKLTRF